MFALIYHGGELAHLVGLYGCHNFTFMFETANRGGGGRVRGKSRRDAGECLAPSQKRDASSARLCCPHLQGGGVRERA